VQFNECLTNSEASPSIASTKTCCALSLSKMTQKTSLVILGSSTDKKLLFHIYRQFCQFDPIRPPPPRPDSHFFILCLFSIYMTTFTCLAPIVHYLLPANIKLNACFRDRYVVVYSLRGEKPTKFPHFFAHILLISAIGETRFKITGKG
jgi:hypothetical protein